jgi:hypothetical protein
MSVFCQECGAVASYGNELGHKSNCPTLKRVHPKTGPEISADIERTKILRTIAEGDPSERNIDEERECFFCKTILSWNSHFLDESKHKSDCLWIAARHVLLNMLKKRQS